MPPSSTLLRNISSTKGLPILDCFLPWIKTVSARKAITITVAGPSTWNSRAYSAAASEAQEIDTTDEQFDQQQHMEKEEKEKEWKFQYNDVGKGKAPAKIVEEIVNHKRKESITADTVPEGSVNEAQHAVSKTAIPTNPLPHWTTPAFRPRKSHYPPTGSSIYPPKQPRPPESSPLYDPSRNILPKTSSPSTSRNSNTPHTPPKPKSLLPNLPTSGHIDTISKQAQLLSNYAERMSDMKTMRATQRVMADVRVGPVMVHDVRKGVSRRRLKRIRKKSERTELVQEEDYDASEVLLEEAEVNGVMEYTEVGGAPEGKDLPQSLVGNRHSRSSDPSSSSNASRLGGAVPQPLVVRPTGERTDSPSAPPPVASFPSNNSTATPLDDAPHITSPPPSLNTIILEESAKPNPNTPAISEITNIPPSSLKRNFNPSTNPAPKANRIPKHKPNRWAIRRWPPNSSSPYVGIQPETFLSWIHSRLTPSFPSALSASPSTTSKFKSLEFSQALDLMRTYCPNHTVEDIRDLIHLYLANQLSIDIDQSQSNHRLNPSSNLSQHFQNLTSNHPDLKPTRQTLHLIIQNILSSPTNPAMKAETIISTISTWKITYKLTPSCETFRHIAKFAIRIGSESLGEMSWRGWWEEYNRLEGKREFGMILPTRELDLNLPTNSILEEVNTNDLQRSKDLVRMDNLELDSHGGFDGLDVSRIKFKFPRRGKDLIRWLRVVRKYTAKGWVRKVDTTISRDHFVWVGKGLETL